jgi:hypothetical protein
MRDINIDIDDERPIRVMTFPERPDVLLVFAKDGQDLWLPRLRSPFARHEVASALSNAEIKARVHESKPGRIWPALDQLDLMDNAERVQRQKQSEAAKHLATISAQDASDIEKARSGLALKKEEADREIRDLKAKIGKAKSDAFVKGVYLSPDRFRTMERRLSDLQTASLAMQGRLTELRRQRQREPAAEERHFIEAAKKKLSKDLYLAIWGLANEMAKPSAPRTPAGGVGEE